MQVGYCFFFPLKMEVSQIISPLLLRHNIPYSKIQKESTGSRVFKCIDKLQHTPNSASVQFSLQLPIMHYIEMEN
jgi:hypothetical protein